MMMSILDGVDKLELLACIIIIGILIFAFFKYGKKIAILVIIFCFIAIWWVFNTYFGFFNSYFYLWDKSLPLFLNIINIDIVIYIFISLKSISYTEKLIKNQKDKLDSIQKGMLLFSSSIALAFLLRLYADRELEIINTLSLQVAHIYEWEIILSFFIIGYYYYKILPRKNKRGKTKIAQLKTIFQKEYRKKERRLLISTVSLFIVLQNDIYFAPFFGQMIISVIIVVFFIIFSHPRIVKIISLRIGIAYGYIFVNCLKLESIFKELFDTIISEKRAVNEMEDIEHVELDHTEINKLLVNNVTFVNSSSQSINNKDELENFLYNIELNIINLEQYDAIFDWNKVLIHSEELLIQADQICAEIDKDIEVFFESSESNKLSDSFEINRNESELEIDYENIDIQQLYDSLQDNIEQCNYKQTIKMLGKILHKLCLASIFIMNLENEPDSFERLLDFLITHLIKRDFVLDFSKTLEEKKQFMEILSKNNPTSEDYHKIKSSFDYFSTLLNQNLEPYIEEVQSQ